MNYLLYSGLLCRLLEQRKDLDSNIPVSEAFITVLIRTLYKKKFIQSQWFSLEILTRKLPFLETQHPEYVVGSVQHPQITAFTGFFKKKMFLVKQVGD